LNLNVLKLTNAAVFVDSDATFSWSIVIRVEL
jgi:hypothetical protein